MSNPRESEYTQYLSCLLRAGLRAAEPWSLETEL